MARNTSATVRRAYAASGRLASETQEIHPALGVSVPPLVATVGYATSADGRLSRITYPDGAAVDYEHDARGDLSRVVSSGAPGSDPSQALELSYLRRADGRLAGMARSNGVASAFTYDAAGRLLSVAHRDRASAVLGSESLRYDAAGRRSSRVREDGAADFFRYDPAGQVTAAAYGLAASADPIAFPASQTFAYDPAGNRTRAVDGPLTASYQANAVNQYSRILVGAAETIPSFDTLGNLLEDDRAAYSWDADIHLLSVAPKDGSVSAAYRYDALHRRVARLEGSATLTYFVHDGWNVVAEYAGSPGSSALAHEVRHVWGEDLGGGLQTAGGVGGLLASVRASGANWAHYDGNGNVVLLTDGAGTASARYAYDAFGRLKSSSGPAAEANRYRFSTKPQERAAALSYYGYRYYAPSQGRWLSRDPLEEEGGVNLYAMVGNDPINSLDSLGQLPIYVSSNFTPEQQTRVNKIIGNIRMTERGAIILSEIEKGDRRLVIAPDWKNNPFYKDDKSGNGTIFFNPYATIYIDVEYKNGKTGKVKASAERILAHELGHAHGTGDEGPGNLDNVNENENPIMEALGEQFKRTKYDGASNKGRKSQCPNIPTTK